jgi:hypothetical protein
MVRARVLFSQAHEEDFPKKFVGGLSEKEILYDISFQPLTLKDLQGYTSVALINPKIPISPEEKEAITAYRQNEGGLFLTFNFLNELHYERSEPNLDLVRDVFGVGVEAKRVLPNAYLGDFEIEYEKDFFGIFKKSVVKRILIDHKEEFSRKIRYGPQQFLQGISKFEIDEDDIDFVTYFTDCDESMVILERGFIDKKFDGRFWMWYRLIFDYGKDGSSTITDDSFHKLERFVRDSIESWRNVGVVSRFSDPGRAAFLVTGKPFSEIENDGESAKTAQNFLESLIVWTSEPTRYRFDIKDEKTERVKELEHEMSPLNQKPELKTQAQELTPIVMGKPKALEPKVKAKEILDMMWIDDKNSGEVVIALEQLATCLIKFGEIDLGFEAIEKRKKIMEKVLSSRGFKEQDTLNYGVDLDQHLRKVISRQGQYHENVGNVAH